MVKESSDCSKNCALGPELLFRVLPKLITLIYMYEKMKEPKFKPLVYNAPESNPIARVSVKPNFHRNT